MGPGSFTPEEPGPRVRRICGGTDCEGVAACSGRDRFPGTAGEAGSRCAVHARPRAIQRTLSGGAVGASAHGHEPQRPHQSAMESSARPIFEVSSGAPTSRGGLETSYRGLETSYPAGGAIASKVCKGPWIRTVE